MIKMVGNNAKTAFVFGKNDAGEERLILTETVSLNKTEDEVLEWLKSTGNRWVTSYSDVYVTFENRYE